MKILKISSTLMEMVVQVEVVELAVFSVVLEKGDQTEPTVVP